MTITILFGYDKSSKKGRGNEQMYLSHKPFWQPWGCAREILIVLLNTAGLELPYAEILGDP